MRILFGQMRGWFTLELGLILSGNYYATDRSKAVVIIVLFDCGILFEIEHFINPRFIVLFTGCIWRLCFLWQLLK
jgi:hypothetical protein